MPLPTDQTGYGVSRLHSGSLENPVPGQTTNPVRSSRDWSCAVCTHQLLGIGPLVRQRFHGVEFKSSSRRPKNAHAFKNPILSARKIRTHPNAAADCIAAKKTDI